MSDYLAKFKIQNGRINALMKENGIENQAQLARLANVGQTALSNILNFRETPMTVDGRWRDPVLRIADVFGVEPDEMFSDEQVLMKLPTNRSEKYINRDDVYKIASEMETSRLLEQDRFQPADKGVSDDEVQKIVRGSISALTPREQKVIKARFGIDQDIMTLEELGNQLGVTGNRVREIEQKALRKLRGPKAAGMFLEGGVVEKDEESFVINLG